MDGFASIRQRAELRKGGAAGLAALLPTVPDPAAVAGLRDDRVLAEMAKRVFCSGFVWRVIEAKWPGFEEAFLGFDVARLCFEPDEFWEALGRDGRIVRHGAKILSVRANARFVAEIAAEHGSFGRFLAGWPAADQAGLLEVLGKRGSRLGGMTGQYLLRFLGWDGWVAGRDVVACLRAAGVEVSDGALSKGDLRRIGVAMTGWAMEAGLPMVHVSGICAMSIGENRATGADLEGEAG